MRVALLALLLVVPSACVTASMVEDRGTSRYAPVNERDGGRIEYRASGALASERREDAYRQMYERCSGRYRITAEWNESAGTITSANATTYGRHAFGSGVSVAVVNRLIDFECEGPQEQEQPQASGDVVAPEPTVSVTAKPAITDPETRDGIARAVGCSSDDVKILKASWPGDAEAFYSATACGEKYACHGLSGQISCRAEGHISAR